MDFVSVLLILFFIAVAVFLFGFLFWHDSERDREQKEKLNDFISNLSDFTPTYKYFDMNNKRGIAIDEAGSKIAFIVFLWNQISSHIVPYKDILRTELLQGESSVKITERKKGAFSRAALGGLVFGPAGAIIGGLSAKTVGTHETTEGKFQLVLIVNNTENPTNYINFGFDERLAKEWQARIEVIIMRADEEEKLSKGSKSVSSLPDSVADELKKLADLRSQGILTDDEFAEQKGKLLEKL